MSLASDNPIRTIPDGLERRLVEELTVTDWRALIVVVVAGPGREQDADRACAAAAAAAGISDQRLLRWVVRCDAAGREQLGAYNRARDNLLMEKRLIYLRTGSAADVRFLREVAPDLTATIDVFVELQADACDESNWELCSRAIRALMEDRHSTLDFTGLLPANADQRVLPLTELYQQLVVIEPDAVDELFERTNPKPGWLVLGHPGTGKTTFARHLAWTYGTRRGDPLGIGDRVPLLFSLSDYGYEREQDRVRSLLQFVPEWLAKQGIEHAASVTENLSDLLLLFDGLDELRSPEARRAVLTEVGHLLRDYDIGGIVVTGRSFLVDELRKQDHVLRLVTTRAPSREQIQAFVTSFVRLRGGQPAHVTDLVARIEGDHDLKALAGTPLMLAFMVVLDELEGRLPDRRIEIYYRLGEMLVDRWTRARSIGAYSSLRERPTRADALRVLGPLAWWTVEQGGGAVSEQALIEEIRRIEARREAPAEASRRATALLELLRSDTALLVPQPGQRWSFVHQSVGEYFAGVEVERDKQRWKTLLANPFRAEWREIVLFCAGQLGVIEGRVDSLDAVIEAVLKKSRRPGRYDAKCPSLLMGLLGEAPGLSRRQTDDLVTRLLDFVFRTAYSEAAAFQVQREFVTLLRLAPGMSRDVLGDRLRELFSEDPESIRWDRIFRFTDVEILEDDEIQRLSLGEVAVYFLGWLGVATPGLARHYQVDLQPTLNRWSREHNWVFRLARWWFDQAQVDANLAFRRTFAEVWQEIADRT